MGRDTSDKAAEAASRVLRDPKSSEDAKTAAASALSQRERNMADDRERTSRRGAHNDDDAEETAPKKKKVELIKVKSKVKESPTGGAPVALHEKHPDHPGGEVFVYGDNEFEVARTAEVSRAIAEGRLAEV